MQEIENGKKRKTDNFCEKKKIGQDIFMTQEHCVKSVRFNDHRRSLSKYIRLLVNETRFQNKTVKSDYIKIY